jgi:hypothetical protein
VAAGQPDRDLARRAHSLNRAVGALGGPTRKKRRCLGEAEAAICEADARNTRNGSMRSSSASHGDAGARSKRGQGRLSLTPQLQGPGQDPDRTRRAGEQLAPPGGALTRTRKWSLARRDRTGGVRPT